MATTQRQLVLDTLLRDGRIEAFDAVYHLTDHDGTPRRITRLAAVIWHLRHVDGWDIETSESPGKMAVYTLVSREKRTIVPQSEVTPKRETYESGPMRGAVVPEGRRGWACSVCGSPPTTDPTPLLDPTFARAQCAACNRPSTFRPR